MKKTDSLGQDVATPSSDLAQAVYRALELDVVVPTEQIRATVADGVVTLEGKVDLWRQYDDIERVIRTLPTVREVRNLLDVESVTPALPGYRCDA